MSDKIKIVHLEGSERRIGDSTPIVRYMRLETLLLLLFERRAFIPSHAALGGLDRLETGILFDLPNQQTFWEKEGEKIAHRMEKFVKELFNREFSRPGGVLTSFPRVPGHEGEFVRLSFREFVKELAVERCVWCWNEFTGNYSNALWRLYGDRGVAIKSTVGDVKEALVKAGVERGIVAPIAYIDHEKSEVSDVLMNEENLFRPYLLKNTAYDYEKEIRFVLAAQREIVNDKEGVLVTFEPDFFKSKVSPHLWREERSIAETIINHHLNKPPAERFPRSADSYWTEIYNRYSGTPFTKQDTLLGVFSDMPASG